MSDKGDTLFGAIMWTLTALSMWYFFANLPAAVPCAYLALLSWDDWSKQ
jgi:hypothetical protein